MSFCVNKTIQIGRIGQDPIFKTVGSGTKLANFSIALNDSWKDEHGEKKEKTTWIRVICWRRNAEVVEQFMRKGTLVYVEGKLDTNTWENKEGQTVTSTVVQCDRILMLGNSTGPKRESTSSPTASLPEELDIPDDTAVF